MHHSILRFAGFAAVLLLSACGHDGAPPPPAVPAPPPQATLCGPASPLGGGDRAALCGLLPKMQEALLPDQARKGQPVYRIVLAPEGQPALSIRFDAGTGFTVGRMTVKRVTAGKLDLSKTFTLEPKTAMALLALADSNPVKALPNVADAPTFAPCKAASRVALEVADGDSYRFAASHCVALKPLRDVANAFLNAAAAKVPELGKNLEQSLD